MQDLRLSATLTAKKKAAVRPVENFNILSLYWIYNKKKRMTSHILKFTDFINEKTSGELFKPNRGKTINFDIHKHPELADEFFELIQIAYKELGGHAKIQTPADIFKDPDWNFWEGIDIHNTNDFDIIVFGQKSRYGIKLSGVGHDGESDSKKIYLEKTAEQLQSPGFFMEVSEKLSQIYIKKYGINVINDQQEVEAILGKKVEWLGKNPEEPEFAGDGWYRRMLGGKPFVKIMIGKPRA